MAVDIIARMLAALAQKSSSNLESKFAPSIEESVGPGSIVTFPDGSNAPAESVVVNILPNQDLHGYDNPWPAGGGKNLFDAKKYEVPGTDNTVSLSGDTYTMTWINGAVVFNTKNIQTFSAGTYMFSVYGTNAENVRVFIYASSDNTSIASGNAGNGVTFTATESFYVGVGGNYSNPGTAVFKIQLESGGSKTSYAPYANICPITGWTGAEIVVSPTSDAQDGTTYNIAFPDEAGTVYGGTLDVTNGTLTVDMASVDLGTLTWTLGSGLTCLFYASPPGIASVVAPPYTNRLAGAICSSYPPSESYTISEDSITDKSWIRNDNVFYIKDSAYSDETTFKTAMSGVQLVYKIATPVTYTLTPDIITMLLGTNNVWADCGNVSVKYLADTKLYIDKKTQ